MFCVNQNYSFYLQSMQVLKTKSVKYFHLFLKIFLIWSYLMNSANETKLEVSIKSEEILNIERIR